MTMRPVAKGFFLIILLLTAVQGKAAYDFLSTTARFSALGGQFYTGTTHSTGFNVDADIVPTLKLRPRLFLVPIYIRSYQETQRLGEFLGQNTLVQRQMDQYTSMRLDWTATEIWHFRPRFGYTNEWIQQSSNETIWNGLFNYYRFFGGMGVEAVLPYGSLAAAYEYSSTHYPHYQSLASDPRLTTTGITQNLGQDVLNFNAHELSAVYDTGLRRMPWHRSAKFTWVRENFADQKLILQAPGGVEGVSNDLRTDDVFLLSDREEYHADAHWLLGLGGTLEYYTSNQNAFDATQFLATPFTYHYYNFVDAGATPTVALSLDKDRWEVRLDGTFNYRKYVHRRAQDVSGSFTGNLIYTTIRGGTFTVRRRLAKGFSLVTTAGLLTSSSNTRFEQNYPYNFTTWNYLGGLSWEY